MKIVSKVLKVISFVLLFLLIVSVFLFTRVDRTPYREMPYYTHMLSEIDSISKIIQTGLGDTIQSGWAKESLVPPVFTPLAGFGNRRGKTMDAIRDSIWVRAFVFDNKATKVVYIAYDLLITPPEVEISLRKKLSLKGFDPENIFFSATHSHCSIGSWGPGFTGQAIAGDYDPEIVEFISEASFKAILKADGLKEKVRIGFGKIHAEEYVANRLVGEEGTVDPWFRFVKLVQEDGQSAILSSFSAHATCFGHKFMHLSRDYPGTLVDSLERSIDFAAFSAGAVGSHTPTWQPTAEEQVAYIANGLNTLVSQTFDTLKTHYEKELKVFHVPLHLREPHVRITENWRLRPWVFYKFFGDYKADISFLRVGKQVWVGTPCDFSGELVSSIEEVSEAQKLNLMVTSFNGGYIGYITADQWYDRNKYETRAMNWFGPYNGAYFTEVIGRVLTIL